MPKTAEVKPRKVKILKPQSSEKSGEKESK
jgi:hypothetical protein